MTYEDFTDFVKKHETSLEKYGSRWFKLDLNTGTIFLDPDGNSNRDGKAVAFCWIYDKYIPHYVGGKYVGFGTYDCIKDKAKPRKPIPVYGDGVEMVILTDIYGDMTYDDGSKIE
jgi:hypothetical protein